MYTREAERKLGSLNGSACLYDVPTMPSAEGMCEEYGHLYPEYRSEGSQRISRELRIRSGGADWERVDALRSLDVVLARVAVQICDGDLDLMMHFNALCELYRALKGLDEGVVAPMLQPRRLSHRPSASRNQTVVKHILVASYSALKRLGLSREEATRDLVELLRRRDVVALLEAQRVLRGERVTKTTVYRWWRKFRGDGLSQTLAEAFRGSGGSRGCVLKETKTLLCRFLDVQFHETSSHGQHAICRPDRRPRDLRA